MASIQTQTSSILSAKTLDSSNLEEISKGPSSGIRGSSETQAHTVSPSAEPSFISLDATQDPEAAAATATLGETLSNATKSLSNTISELSANPEFQNIPTQVADGAAAAFERARDAKFVQDISETVKDGVQSLSASAKDKAETLYESAANADEEEVARNTSSTVGKAAGIVAGTLTAVAGKSIEAAGGLYHYYHDGDGGNEEVSNRDISDISSSKENLGTMDPWREGYSPLNTEETTFAASDPVHDSEPLLNKVGVATGAVLGSISGALTGAVHAAENAWARSNTSDDDDIDDSAVFGSSYVGPRRRSSFKSPQDRGVEDARLVEDKLMNLPSDINTAAVAAKEAAKEGGVEVYNSIPTAAELKSKVESTVDALVGDTAPSGAREDPVIDQQESSASVMPRIKSVGLYAANIGGGDVAFETAVVYEDNDIRIEDGPLYNERDLVREPVFEVDSEERLLPKDDEKPRDVTRDSPVERFSSIEAHADVPSSDFVVCEPVVGAMSTEFVPAEKGFGNIVTAPEVPQLVKDDKGRFVEAHVATGSVLPKNVGSEDLSSPPSENMSITSLPAPESEAHIPRRVESLEPLAGAVVGDDIERKVPDFEKSQMANEIDNSAINEPDQESFLVEQQDLNSKDHSEVKKEERTPSVDQHVTPAVAPAEGGFLHQHDVKFFDAQRPRKGHGTLESMVGHMELGAGKILRKEKWVEHGNEKIEEGRLEKVMASVLQHEKTN